MHGPARVAVVGQWRSAHLERRFWSSTLFALNRPAPAHCSDPAFPGRRTSIHSLGIIHRLLLQGRSIEPIFVTPSPGVSCPPQVLRGTHGSGVASILAQLAEPPWKFRQWRCRQSLQSRFDRWSGLVEEVTGPEQAGMGAITSLGDDITCPASVDRLFRARSLAGMQSIPHSNVG